MEPDEFARKVVDAYNAGRGVFANKVNAEDHLPEGFTDLEKAQFLFYVIQLDYATKSQRLYENAKNLVQENPKALKPQYISSLSDNELKNLLSNLSPRYINEAVTRYKKNTGKLLDDYGGDPREVFEEAETAKGAVKLTREFRGFGPKIGNFFVRTMVNTFGYDYANIEDILPPVDRHDVNIAYILGYVESNEMTDKNVQRVKKLWSNACQEADVSWLTFDKALWLLGSEGQSSSKSAVISLIAA